LTREPGDPRSRPRLGWYPTKIGGWLIWYNLLKKGLTRDPISPWETYLKSFNLFYFIFFKMLSFLYVYKIKNGLTRVIQLDTGQPTWLVT
jgi:hypothetical protein